MQSNSNNESLSAIADWAALIGRVGLGSIFLWSGLGKLVYMAGNVAYMNAFGVPAAELLIWPALLIELIAGALLVVGWKERWAAVALIVFTIPATIIFHAYWGAPADQVLNQHVHFLKNLAIIGGLLGVVAHGAGRLALPRLSAR
jgi:putative oxidoreductase